MAIHLIKLCVGADGIEDIRRWQARILADPGEGGARGTSAERGLPVHVTRMTPKRVDEVLDGGSMYWVTRGFVTCRQEVRGLEEVRGEDGVRRCAIVLDPALVATEPMPRKAFQGWRYLALEDAPADLGADGAGAAGLPEPLRRELMAIGAW